ncbi:hypothetical protein [Natrononativus amylolyticus]|uniref:hypothetical protein n=1 Tax=Natrononativus amylolyticus TaxID=2963434 RepID=UPI0020CC3F25|nr:hypothetical protein [Natrononativus amylolyticus]
MNALPGGLHTDQQPPMTIPLRHFVVGLAFLVAGVGMGTVQSVSSLPGLDSIAHVHLLLIGWICLTIMGAMTQFVPVWSGVTLYSRRLAVVQLWLVSGGLVGFVAVLLAGRLVLLPAFATLLLAGIWVFVYNVGRTLARARPLDSTERHFAFALGCFAAVAPLGVALAVDLQTPVFDALSVGRFDVILAHATLAVFGGVLATVVGALSQLATMFTQASPARIDRPLLRLEAWALPAGVVCFALGRGLGSLALARVGALAVLVGAAAFALVVAGLLSRASVDRSPMTARYWVVVGSLLAWAALAAPAWWRDPMAPDALFGAPGTSTLLVVGVFGFVVVGTLYHVIPFIVWLDRYSDRLGFERVPMIDDLYSSRLERVDFAATVAGFAGLAAAGLLPVPAAVVVAGGVSMTIGFAVFAANMLLVIHRHGPGGFGGALSRSRSDSEETVDVADERATG